MNSNAVVSVEDGYGEFGCERQEKIQKKENELTLSPGNYRLTRSESCSVIENHHFNTNVNRAEHVSVTSYGGQNPSPKPRGISESSTWPADEAEEQPAPQITTAFKLRDKRGGQKFDGNDSDPDANYYYSIGYGENGST